MILSSKIQMKNIFKFIPALTLALTACDKPMEKFDVERNSHPRVRYQLTMKINKSPGPFDSAKGSMTYEIRNQSCVRPAPISGVRVSQSEYPEFEMKKIAEDTYVGDVYFDLLEGGDYYGLGVCYWRLQSVNINLMTKSNILRAGFSAKKIQDEQPRDLYFLLDDYEQGDRPKDNSAVPLNENNKKFLDEFFSVTFTGKRMF